MRRNPTDKVNELLAADNSFAVVTAAHTLTKRTRNNEQERYKAKQLLVRLLYQRKWDKMQSLIDLKKPTKIDSKSG